MATKLYVGNFPWSTTEDDLRNVFEQYGEVKSVKLVTDRETGRSRGFAFIEFADADACQEAMDVENGRDLNGRELKVREAVDKPREPRTGSGDNRERPFRPRPPQAQEHARPTPPPVDHSNGANKRHREHRPRRDDRDYRD